MIKYNPKYIFMRKRYISINRLVINVGIIPTFVVEIVFRLKKELRYETIFGVLSDK